jgi:hypothetical protein
MASTHVLKTALPNIVASRDLISINPRFFGGPAPASRATTASLQTTGYSFSSATINTSSSKRSLAITKGAAVDAPTAEVKDYGVQVIQGKRLQVISAPVAEDTITIRCLDWDRDRFDIEFG